MRAKTQRISLPERGESRFVKKFGRLETWRVQGRLKGTSKIEPARKIEFDLKDTRIS